MSWENRDWNRGDGGGRGGMRPGGDWRGTRPSLDNPVTWSIGIARIFGIDVRVHFVFLLYVLIELFWSLGATDIGASMARDTFYTIISLGGLFVLVLLHEFGHCFACRSTGGDANEILMWPLGGLAYCQTPHRWTANLWTVAGGPLVNVFFLVVFGAYLGVRTGTWLGVALPVPIPGFVPDVSGLEGLFDESVFFIAQMNAMLLYFNLLPMFPLDGGRAIQCLMWPKLGYVRSMRIAVRIGYIAAIAIGLFAVVTFQPMMIAIAIFAGFTCFNTYRQLKYTEEVMGFEYAEYAMNLEEEHRKPEKVSKREARKAEKRIEKQEQDERELDRLLEKIKQDGMASLSAREKRWLESQSKKKKDE